MEKTKKAPTRKEMFTAVSDFLANNNAEMELIDFINHQIELVSKKKTSADGTAKPSKAQEENRELAPQFIEAMEFDKLYTSGELMNMDVASNFNDTHDKLLSVPKITNIMAVAVEMGLVEKSAEKRKTYYKRIA